jgi:hypothetical protein
VLCPTALRPPPSRPAPPPPTAPVAPRRGDVDDLVDLQQEAALQRLAVEALEARRQQAARARVAQVGGEQLLQHRLQPRAGAERVQPTRQTAMEVRDAGGEPGAGWREAQFGAQRALQLGLHGGGMPALS